MNAVISAQENAPEEQGPEVTEARALEISQELSARQTAIENIQSDLGIYDPFVNRSLW
ncbi:MAG: hypothetical protein CM1200mP40_00140 [Gammaproteobacteria bacterium]|nr:MAG: hypothetical protein CM1200mP40_00140 [Gammaproteobacteria bacterium]